MKGCHRLRTMGLKRVPAPQDRQSVGMAWARLPQQLLEGHLLRLVFALGEFFEDHLPFHGEVVGIEPWLQHQIQQQGERFTGCFGRDQHVEMDVIETGGGVAAATEGFDAAIKFARR